MKMKKYLLAAILFTIAAVSFARVYTDRNGNKFIGPDYEYFQPWSDYLEWMNEMNCDVYYNHMHLN